jgi:hypothetical protein
MKKIVVFLTALLMTALLVQLIALEKKRNSPPPEPELTYRVDDTPTIPRVSRIGINLGRLASNEALPLGNNVIQNPGIEGQIDRLLIIVSQADEESFSDEAGWGNPNSTWNEAEYQIRTGKSTGKGGVVKRSLNSGKNGFPQYFSQEPLPPLEPNDIIVLTKVRRPDLADFWKARSPVTTSIDTGNSRPQSLGNQSLKLRPTAASQAEVTYTFDAIGERTEKGLPVKDKWQFRIWAKGEKPNGELALIFERANRSSPFFKTVIDLTTDWQEYVIDFESKDTGPSGRLELSIIAFHPNNAVWIDDLYLGPLQDEAIPFRKEVVDAIKTLHPSFLREFPSVADTWENRIAPPQQRKTWLWRTSGGRQVAIFSYSLPEFLSLCRETDANPWLILPPTFSNYECHKFGLYLSKHANRDVFSEVILEFGNENWNWLRRPAAIPYDKQHGTLANRLFNIVEKAAGQSVHLLTLINGQYTAPWQSIDFLDSAENADGLALAPYILPSLTRATPDLQTLNSLYTQDMSSFYETSSEVNARNKRLALYEINLGTLQGNAGVYERNRLITSAASGSALAKHLLNYLTAGVNPLMVFNLAQYDTPAWEVEGYVNLWGIVRDFGPPLRLRPTGLAVKMLNHVIQGGLYQLKPEDKDSPLKNKITLAAFRGETAWSLAAVSENDRPTTIRIEFPSDGHKLPESFYSLQFHSPFDNNEEAENVTISKQPVFVENSGVTLTIPAWGLVVLGD